MKVTPVQYAKALYEATRDKKHQEIDKLVLNFVKIIAGNNQLRLKDNIIGKFGEIYNQENNIIEAEVISREKLSSLLVDKLISFIKGKYKAKKVVIKNIIDEKVGGGVVIQVGDEVIDGSVVGQLKELKIILER